MQIRHANAYCTAWHRLIASSNLSVTCLWDPHYKKVLNCWKPHSSTFCPAQRLPKLLKFLLSLHKPQAPGRACWQQGQRWQAGCNLSISIINNRAHCSEAPLQPSSQVSCLCSHLTPRLDKTKKHQCCCTFGGSKDLSPVLKVCQISHLTSSVRSMEHHSSLLQAYKSALGWTAQKKGNMSSYELQGWLDKDTT